MPSWTRSAQLVDGHLAADSAGNDSLERQFGVVRCWVWRGAYPGHEMAVGAVAGLLDAGGSVNSGAFEGDHCDATELLGGADLGDAGSRLVEGFDWSANRIDSHRPADGSAAFGALKDDSGVSVNCLGHLMGGDHCPTDVSAGQRVAN